MPNLESLIPSGFSADECVEVNISAGLSQGKPQIEIESVMELARFNQKPIARFECKLGG
jgi:hypothetical protein